MSADRPPSVVFGSHLIVKGQVVQAGEDLVTRRAGPADSVRAIAVIFGSLAAALCGTVALFGWPTAALVWGLFFFLVGWRAVVEFGKRQ